MAATAAQTGFGTVVEYLSTDPSTYSTIGELKAVTPPNRTRETADATHMASPNAHREFIATLFDGGESTLTFNYTEAGAVLLNTLMDAGLETFRITLNGGSTIIFTAVPTAVEFDDVTVDGVMGMSMTLKVSGKPLFTMV